MKMIQRATVLVFLLNLLANECIEAKKQQLSLSDSYLPVAMQVIAHLTDQMAFEIKDEPNTKPTAKPPRPPRPSSTSTRPTPPKPSAPPNRPIYTTSKPTNAWQTSATWKPTTNGWWMTLSTNKAELTTAFHKPGIYAPLPPKSDKYIPKEFFVLLPIDHNSEYTIIEPNVPTSEPLLAPEVHEEVNPIVDPKPEKEPLLPLASDVPISRSDEMLIGDDELTDENLQYLSQELRDMIKLAHNPNDERGIDIWGEDTNKKAYLQQAQTKAKLSGSNLRLLLLYDLLSREAKKQKLSDFTGFSDVVMKELIESGNNGARQQLRFVLQKMLDRKDCQHDYANNRAREMVTELGKDESTLSNEIRYLQPLVYKL